jgi:polysaccharide biosynthesis/export protein
MFLHRTQSHLIALVCVLPFASCSWVSESGPLKAKINEGSPSYTITEVKSAADVPARNRTYGLAQLPPANKGEAYSDKIRPRDNLIVVVTDLSEQSPFHSKDGTFKYGPIEVPQDGRISIPYVGEIQVIDRSLADVAAILGEKVLPVSNTARVSVSRGNRIAKTANVIGEVRNPGPVSLEKSGITSVDLLAVSGGPKDHEHLFTYTLRRNSKDYAFDYLGFRQHAFPVEEGDLLSISEDTSNRFHVMGAINRSVSVNFPVPSPTLADALGAAAGLDERRSDPSGVFIFRRGNPNQVYTLNLNDPSVIHLVQGFPIQGNDIIYVTEAPLARWNRALSQFLPIAASQATTAATRIGN